MTSSRPYLLRAIYEWITDNHLTPYILVDATDPGAVVPERFVENGKIVLNIESQAVGALRMGNDAVEFKARFSGAPFHLFIPIPAIKAIYAHENGRGMFFNNEDDVLTADGEDPHTPPPSTPPKGRPNLKVVK